VFAARAGNCAEVKVLLDRGVNPDGSDDNLGGPLFVALAARHYEVVRVLLEKGASVDITDPYGDGPLEYALHHGDDKSVFELLGYDAKLRLHTKVTYQSLLEQALKRR
jgi:ankyrin repeat protein